MHTNTKLFLACITTLAAASAGAQHNAARGLVSVTAQSMQGTATASAGWSDADYARAQALPLPRVSVLPASVFDYNAAVSAASFTGSGASAAGSAGGRDAAGLAQRKTYSALLLPAAATDGVAPSAVGTMGVHFTSTRVYPNNSDTTYPTRTVGKLYFRDPSTGGRYMCSGSMIKPGVVVTAGHCVHRANCRGGSEGFYDSFEFIPGFRRVGAVETRPYGTWANWAYATTTTTWACGGGGVPNAGDFALIVFNRNGSGYRIGDYTGWLGYKYPAMIGRHNSVLGYPGNLDSGGQLHRVESMVTDSGTGNGSFGSDMEGGSSGGPIVLNLRADYVNSSPVPSEYEGNRVTSVVSWGYIDPARKVQGGTQLNGTFGTMVTNTCSAYPWAC
ncbi:trypsin-like serine protease [Eleftheria terrae]|uniref:trypsin-like serine protease n=1 Tax=Eleftheria terrae TaxID=1597781 RepID=UPI00263AFC71|nr:trypsin-like serine protease [Eleftheria terrae]WKB53076.1 trypsin-like serine protease [Eleftheria terrae]